MTWFSYTQVQSRPSFRTLLMKKLTCVEVALPESVKHLAHVHDAVTAFVMPLTLDNAARHGCADVLMRFRTKPCSTSAMFAAVANGHYLFVYRLLRLGKMASQSMIANQALKRAAEQGDGEAVQLLVRDGSDDAVSRALSYATRNGHWGIVEVLYGRGGAGFAVCGEVLRAAARAGREDVVQLVRPRCWAKDVAGALQDAAKGGRWEVVKALYKHTGPDAKELGVALTCATAAANREVVGLLLPLCDEKSAKDALRSASLQRHWGVVKLLCERLQMPGCETVVRLVEKDEGCALLDLLYKRCRCYDAEKAVAEALRHENWTAIKLLANVCYKGSKNVLEAFNLAVSTGRWDVVKVLYQECSSEAATEALMQAAAVNEKTVVDVLATKCSVVDLEKARSQLSLIEKPALLEARSKLKDGTIRCITPGARPFEIDTTSISTIDDLKKKVREMRPELFADVSSTAIWLYLAKRGNEWLSENPGDIDHIERGDCSSVRDLLVWPIMSNRQVKDVFKDTPQPLAKTIQVIAMKPILRCIIPGSRPFGINLDKITHINDMKKAIKEEAAEAFAGVDAGGIRLYLAQEDGVWLPLSSPTAKALMVGERHSSMDAIFSREVSSMAQIGGHFADVFSIHVVIMSPDTILKPLRDMPSSRRFNWDILNARLLELQ